MTVVLAGLVCGVAGVALAALVYERQLRRLARSLRERDAHSNTRLTVEAPGRAHHEKRRKSEAHPQHLAVHEAVDIGFQQVKHGAHRLSRALPLRSERAHRPP